VLSRRSSSCTRQSNSWRLTGTKPYSSAGQFGYVQLQRPAGAVRPPQFHREMLRQRLDESLRPGRIESVGDDPAGDEAPGVLGGVGRSPRLASPARTTFRTTVLSASGPVGRQAVAYSAERQSTTMPGRAMAGRTLASGPRQTSVRCASPGRRPHMSSRYGGIRSPNRTAPHSAEMTTIHAWARRRDAGSRSASPSAS